MSHEHAQFTIDDLQGFKKNSLFIALNQLNSLFCICKMGSLSFTFHRICEVAFAYLGLDVVSFASLVRKIVVRFDSRNNR